MSKKIFVNLPVKDLERTMKFFGELGYSFNPQFTDEKAACMVVSDDIYVMLLTEEFFKTFTSKEVADARKMTEVLVCLNEESREAVEAHVEKALKAGGTETREAQDNGYMYGRSFNDPDGHIWEIIWMDEAAVAGQ